MDKEPFGLDLDGVVLVLQSRGGHNLGYIAIVWAKGGEVRVWGEDGSLDRCGPRCYKGAYIPAERSTTVARPCHRIRMPKEEKQGHGEAQPLAPVLKWPGGKRSLVSAIEPFLDRPYDRLVEPFCGGAALFFHLRPPAALLADRNAELINAYVQIRDNVEDLVDRLKGMRNTEEAYYQLRDRKPRTALTRAARFVYLMQLSFNGIYRENLRGDFNVPYGYKTWLTACDEERLCAASLALQGTECEAQTYGETMESLRETDLVYVDPPYTVSHNDNGFIKYNRTLFSWDDQGGLAVACEQARRKGSLVIVSNADHSEIRALYPEFEYHQLNRFCPISGSAGGRKHVTEALLVGRPT